MDFTFEQLQDLDTKTKDEYMQRILNEDAAVATYIKDVFKKCEETEDSLVAIEYGIDDTREDWDNTMQDINDNLYKNAL